MDEDELREPGQGVKIHVYSMMHNEETLLPYFLRHYGSFCDRIVIYDNESDDKTAVMARQAGCLVIPVATGGKHDVAKLREVMNGAYKASRGEADWVICAEGDEFFWRPELHRQLLKYMRRGITLPKIAGYDMVSEDPPKGVGQIYDELKRGFPNKIYGKRGIFHPSIDINFEAGGHVCHPEGNVVESEEAEINLLHYRYLGERYFARRYEMHRKRLNEEAKKMGWGTECLEDHLVRYWKAIAQNCAQTVQVVP